MNPLYLLFHPDHYSSIVLQLSLESGSYFSKLPKELLQYLTNEFLDYLPNQTEGNELLSFLPLFLHNKEYPIARKLVNSLVENRSMTWSVWVGLHDTYHLEVAEKKKSLRQLKKFTDKNEDARRSNISENFIKKLSQEIISLSDTVVNMLINQFIPPNTPLSSFAQDSQSLHSDEIRIVLLKVIGDHLYNKWEVDRHSVNEERMIEFYQQANIIATKNLHPTNRISLMLNLSYGLSLYNIGQTEAATKLLSDTFHTAVEGLDCVCTEDSYRNATVVLQLIRDLLTIWTEVGEENDDYTTRYDEELAGFRVRECFDNLTIGRYTEEEVLSMID
eukprot:TRINITY_DN2796_c0_g2_i3.p1 TRINITY_DN2796_c0_g2~~TRINITY_DN2796_c0_g2_i3.p1  ORF type:complete len:332 (-),score=35.68 TRINITY_DN2796_c0_g2_i3:13-1008(-)